MNEMVVKYGGPSCMKNKHWVLKNSVMGKTLVDCIQDIIQSLVTSRSVFRVCEIL